MRFQYPIALLLLLSIPLVLFVRRRRPVVRLRVSNLYLWTHSSPQDAPALVRHLRRHWILLLQVGILGLTAVSAAGLLLDSGNAPAAVILDGSITMGIRDGGRSRFDMARAQIVALSERLPGRTRVRLFAADPRPRFIGEFRAADSGLRQALDGLRVTDAAADLVQAIEFARNGTERPGRIYVFSDAASSETISTADVEWSSVGGPANNAAISNVSVRPSRTTENDAQVLVTVVNHGESPVTSDLTLTINDEEVGRQRVSVPPDENLAYTFPVSARQGVAMARLEGADALLNDNVRMTLIPSRAKAQVLLTGRRSFFLEKALSAHPGVTLLTSDAAQPDVVICNACGQIPSGTANVLLIPEQRGAADPVALIASGASHPVTDGLDFDGTPAVRMAADSTPHGTVLALAGNEPAIVAEETGTRRILELRLDPQEGPFSLSTAFPMLIANAISWLSHENENAVALTAGEPLQWRVGAQATTPTVIGPGDRVTSSTFANGLLSLTDTSIAGLYRIQLDSGERMLVVNPAVRDRASSDGLPRARRVDQSDTAGSTAPGTDFTIMLALAALALLAIEWLYGLRPKRVA